MKKKPYENLILLLAIVSLGAASFIAGSTFAHKRFESFRLNNAVEFPAQQFLQEKYQIARKPEVVGKIVSVVGNQITIAKLEQPEMDEEEIDFEAKKAEMESLTAEERIAKMEERLNAFTGENIIVEIQAGIEITQRAKPPADVEEEMREIADQSSFLEEESTLISPTELAEGDYVAVWLNQNILDENIAEFINLIFTEKDDITK